MIAMFHSIAVRASAFVQRTIARVCAFCRAAIRRARAVRAAIVRFLGG